MIGHGQLTRDLVGARRHRVRLADEQPLAALVVEHDLRGVTELLDLGTQLGIGELALDIVPQRDAVLAVAARDVRLAVRKAPARGVAVLHRRVALRADVRPQPGHVRRARPQVLADVAGEQRLLVRGGVRLAMQLELAAAVGSNAQAQADRLAACGLEVGRVAPQLRALKRPRVMQAHDERRVDLVEEAVEAEGHERLRPAGPVGPFAAVVAREDEDRRLAAVRVGLAQADRPLDELLA